MAQNFMGMLEDLGEVAVQRKVERRMERVRQEAEQQVRHRLYMFRKLAPTLEKYQQTGEVFTTYKLGMAVYGPEYRNEYNGNASILPGEIGYALHELAELGVLKEVVGLCNPSCPYLYQFA